jgi:hypothetical protein
MYQTSLFWYISWDFWTLNCELKNYKITGIYIVETLLLLLIKLDYSNSIVLHKYTISEWVIVTFIYINFQWNDDKVRFALYEHAELDFSMLYFIFNKHNSDQYYMWNINWILTASVA